MTPTEALRIPAHHADPRPSAATSTPPLAASAARWVDALFRPVDAAWLSALRILFGLALAVSMQRFVAYGWIDELLVAPRHRFHYAGFAWVEPLGSTAMHALFYALGALALAMAAGFAFRVTAPLFALGLTYIQLVDVSTYLNHYYLAALVVWLLALSPANRAWSIDAWMKRRKRARRANGEQRANGATDEPRVATAWLWLFRFQIGVVYVFAGLAKAQSDWLLHGQPLGIWLGASTHLPVLGELFTLPGAPLVMSWLGFLFDTTIVLWLSWRRTRVGAYAVVIVFHATTRLLFDIGMFPILMTTAALVFFPPDWPRRLHANVKRGRPGPTVKEVANEAAREGARDDAADATSRGATEVRRPPSRWQLAAVGLGGLYVVVQLALPLRCHLYGGNVLWDEQGMRFSWRVMVRAKGGATTFIVRETRTGRTMHVSPRDYLTPFQENEMAGQPDLVLQLAHVVGRDFEARGHGPVEVYVDSTVSLNGRRAHRFIRPDVDLRTIQDGLAKADWILPAPSEAPPSIRPVR